MGDGLVEGAPREAERRRRDGRAEDVQRPHGDLEAFAGRAQPAVRGNAATLEAKRGQGCGAMTSIRSATEKPGSSAKTTKAERPRAPGASPVRAKTV